MAVVSLNGIFTLKVMRSPLMIPHSMGDSPPPWMSIEPVSQWEREAIGERTRDALRHKRGNGERVGNIAFGYRLSSDGRHLEPNPDEQAALAAIRTLRSQGHPLRWIAATLNSHGHRTRRGTQWRLESVARVVQREAGSPSRC